MRLCAGDPRLHTDQQPAALDTQLTHSLPAHPSHLDPASTDMSQPQPVQTTTIHNQDHRPLTSNRNEDHGTPTDVGPSGSKPECVDESRSSCQASRTIVGECASPGAGRTCVDSFQSATRAPNMENGSPGAWSGPAPPSTEPALETSSSKPPPALSSTSPSMPNSPAAPPPAPVTPPQGTSGFSLGALRVFCGLASR